MAGALLPEMSWTLGTPPRMVSLDWPVFEFIDSEVQDARGHPSGASRKRAALKAGNCLVTRRLRNSSGFRFQVALVFGEQHSFIWRAFFRLNTTEKQARNYRQRETTPV